MCCCNVWILWATHPKSAGRYAFASYLIQTREQIILLPMGGLGGRGGSDLTSMGGEEGDRRTVASQFWKKRKRETLKSPTLHTLRMPFLAASRPPPWLPPLLLQESSHIHKTSTEIARIHIAIAMSCATSYLHYFMIFLHIHIYIISSKNTEN